MRHRRITRREFLSISGLAAVGLIAAACAPSAAPAPTTSPTQAAGQATEAPTAAPATVASTAVPPTMASKAPTKIVWWNESYNDAMEKNLTTNFVDTFNAAHPDTPIDLTYQENLDQTLRTAVQAGAGPDVVITPGPGFVLEYINAGYILDLSDFAVQYGWKDKLLSWAYDSGTVNGKLYSLPLTFESVLVYYNKTVFDKQAWQPPTTGDEMVALCEAAKKANIYALSAGNSDWKAATEWFVGPFLDEYAGDDNYYKALIGEKKWTDPEFVGAIKMLNDWFQKGYFSGSIDNYHALTGNDYVGNLANGKAAMMIDGTWAFADVPGAFEQSGQDWDWFPMPPLNTGVHQSYGLAIGTTVSINAKSKIPDAAAKALDWIVNDKKRAMTIASGMSFGEWVVPLHFTPEDFPANVDKRIARFYQDFVAVTGRGDYGYTTWTFWPPKTEEYVYQGFDDVMAGTTTVEQYLAQIQQQFDAERTAGKTPPVPKRNV